LVNILLECGKNAKIKPYGQEGKYRKSTGFPEPRSPSSGRQNFCWIIINVSKEK
jgi:hypothetical protein